MGSLRQSLLRDAAGDPTFVLFLVAVALCLFQSADQPGVDAGLGQTTVTVVPSDVVLAALAIAVAIRIGRRRTFPSGARPDGRGPRLRCPRRSHRCDERVRRRSWLPPSSPNWRL